MAVCASSSKLAPAAILAAVLAVGLIPGVPVYADTPTSWSGAYIGGHVGAAWREYSWHNARPFAGGTDYDFNSAASIAGGQIGLQHQFGRWVAGGELSLSGGRIDKSSGDVPGAHNYKTDIHNIFTATGKLGYALDRWLAYGKAGYAQAEFINSGILAGGATFRSSGTHSGFILGAGIDYALSSNLTIGVAYDWLDLGSEQRAGFSSAGVPFGFTAAPGSIHAVTTRVSFKLGRAEPEAEPLK